MTPPARIADQPGSWPVVEATDLHRDDWVLALRADTITLPEGGGPFRRLVVELPGAVIILAVDERDRVVVLQHYRHPVGGRLVGLPAGMLDVAGEPPEQTARRELQEEAGLVADHWEHLVTTYPSAGVSSETHAIFLATGLHEVGRGDFELEHEEADMTVSRVPMAELVDAVLGGDVGDGPLAIAVLAYEAKRHRE